ncbi:hypothetical protein ABKN59_010662 [Abortiporus biennis]
MRRYLSLSRGSRKSMLLEPTIDEKSTDHLPSTSTQEKKTTGGGGESSSATESTNDVATETISSTTALVTPSVPLPPPNLKVKRVDHYWSNWSKAWKYKNTGTKITAETGTLGSSNSSGNDPWQSFCFVVVRKLPRLPEDGEPTFTIVIKSSYLIETFKKVIKTVPGVSWTAEPLELDPHLLIAFLPDLESYHVELSKKRGRSTEETYTINSLKVLLDYLRKDYRATIAKIASLISHGEITYDLLYAIMVPHSTLITECPVTGEPRALELMSATRVSHRFYDLLCESIDAIDHNNNNAGSFNHHSAEDEIDKAGLGKSFGRVQNRVIIPAFKGTVNINSLSVYPIKYHVREQEVRKVLVERGKKWESLRGIHHMQYKGAAAWVITQMNGKKTVKYNVNSRIMIDRVNFRRLNPNYELPVIKAESTADNLPTAYDDYGNPLPNNDTDPNRGIPTLKVQANVKDLEVKTQSLSDDELLLASPVVYGFSLADKMWLEFNVELVKTIVWNDEAFRSLVLPPGRKTLLQSLVEAHNQDLGFDDFVQGKGHGLVINLFGPPGVGKTLSAEATSEHVKRPLYVVGAGDLGTSATLLDDSLQKVFDIATSWKAIVLIDEADVFLEQRSLHDLERNAMVAVFLRHVEYYRGILFLTTNRIKTFDEAFLSRIHVALHFQELTKAAKIQVWRAFLTKVGVQFGSDEGCFKEEWLEKLGEKDINGRQIKNATRTATSLAVSRKEKIGLVHLLETLDAMEDFTVEFGGRAETRMYN